MGEEVKALQGLLVPEMLDLHKEIARCTTCPLWKTRTHVVPGEGPVPCDVMLVGEGPGGAEDRTGRPFVGMAGQLLRRLLQEEARLDPEAVYITNVVKCRSFERRGGRAVDVPPPPACRVACEPFLVVQRLLVQPKVTIVVGSVASQLLVGKAIGEVAGTLMVFPDGSKYLPILHPAAALRSEEAMEELRYQVRGIGMWLDDNPDVRRRKDEYPAELFVGEIAQVR